MTGGALLIDLLTGIGDRYATLSSNAHCALDILYTGSVAQTVAYALQSPAPPFPVFCLGYAINGFGIALQVPGI